MQASVYRGDPVKTAQRNLFSRISGPGLICSLPVTPMPEWIPCFLILSRLTVDHVTEQPLLSTLDFTSLVTDSP